MGRGFLDVPMPKDKNLKSFGPARVCVVDERITLEESQELAKNETADPPFPSPSSQQKTLMEGFFLQKCDLLTADKTILATTRMVGDVAKEHFVPLPETAPKNRWPCRFAMTTPNGLTLFVGRRW